MNKFISNSQHADDYIAWQLLDKPTTGVVVEVGAFDGLHLSNSMAFEQLGWSSICIEPNPTIFKHLEINRLESININCAIVGDNNITEIDFYAEEIGVLSGCNYDEEDIKRRYVNRGLKYSEPKKIVVPAKTLTSILENSVNKNTIIDIISIDVEGFEMEVLKGLDLDKYKVNLFIIEANTETEMNSILEYFELQSEYIYLGRNFQNLFIARKSSISKKSLRNLKFDGYTKAAQIHPIDDKLSLDSVPPNFIKSSGFHKMQKRFKLF